MHLPWPLHWKDAVGWNMRSLLHYRFPAFRWLQLNAEYSEGWIVQYFSHLIDFLNANWNTRTGFCLTHPRFNWKLNLFDIEQHTYVWTKISENDNYWTDHQILCMKMYQIWIKYYCIVLLQWQSITNCLLQWHKRYVHWAGPLKMF